VNLDRLHATVIELCRIPSPSRRERRVAEYVRERIAGLGLVAVEDDAARALEGDTGNLHVRLDGGRGEPIFLCAHMDTVAVPALDPIPVIVEPDRIHTGGASVLGGDDKVGVALALELLAEAVARPGESRPLDVIFCVQEEIGCRGSGAFDASRVRARDGFVLDGETPAYTAIREAPTKEWYRVAVSGRRAHAAVNPEEGRNAVAAAGALAGAFPGGRIGRGAVANAGSLSGGGSTNVVPDHAELVGELRCLRDAEQARWRRRFERIAARVMRRRGTSATVQWDRAYSGYYVPDDAPCARWFAEACVAEGAGPSFFHSLGGGDANQLNAKGLRCIVVGLGMEAIHSPQEQVIWSRLDAAARVVERLVFPPKAEAGAR
jgi:tripeptide aminopeptidase